LIDYIQTHLENPNASSSNKLMLAETRR